MGSPRKLDRIAAERGAPQPQKKAVNLSINRDLLNRARSGDLNLSGILEAALEQKLRQQERERWLRDNRASLEAYNQDVENYGVFSDRLRAF